MKTQSYFIRALLLSVIIIISSCSKDEAPPVISASDLNSTIDENPESGASIGTISTNIEGTFLIISQTPNGAFAINSQTGEVTIADASLFDFETNNTLEAVVVATGSGTESVAKVNVTLNNIDDIAFLLSDSKEAYEAASDGEWINITEDEFNLLATSLNEVNKIGTTDEHYDQSITVSAGAGWTRVNTVQPSMPSGSLLFAFKYLPNNGTTLDTKIKLSTTSSTTGYMDVGTGLPVSQLIGRNGYFLLKGYNTPTTAPGYLCIYPTGGIDGIHNVTGHQGGSKSGNHNDLSDALFNDGFVFFYQGLSTTQKQWD